MVNISDLKTYILEERMIEAILEGLGCEKIKHKSGYYQCCNPDGDNETALCVYENENLTVVDYTRDIKNGRQSADIITAVQFFESLSFPKAVQRICSWVGLDYYHDFEADLPLGVTLPRQLLKEIGDSNYEEEKPVLPISETILGYYKNRVNDEFLRDNISYETQVEWEIGFDEESNRITIPIRDEIGTLVGVKGRILGNPTENEMKYIYLEPCARSKILFGLNRASESIKIAGTVYVAEAEKSVLQLWDMGVFNCVATGGKKVSQQQIELLTRLCVNIVFIFDKDVERTELEDLADRFVDSIQIYAVIDDLNILDKKESPTDNPVKYKKLLSQCVRRLK